MFKIPEKIDDVDYALLVFGRNLLEEVSNYQMGSIVHFNKTTSHVLNDRVEGCKKTLELTLELKIEDAMKEENLEEEMHDQTPREILHELSYFGYMSVMGETLMGAIDINYLRYLQRSPHHNDYKDLKMAHARKIEKLAKSGYKEMKLSQDIAYGIAAGHLVYEFVNKDMMRAEGPVEGMAQSALAAMNQIYREYCEEEIRPAMMVDILKANIEGMLSSFEPVYKDGSKRGAEKAES